MQEFRVRISDEDAAIARGEAIRGGYLGTDDFLEYLIGDGLLMEKKMLWHLNHAERDDELYDLVETARRDFMELQSFLFALWLGELIAEEQSTGRPAEPASPGDHGDDIPF